MTGICECSNFEINSLNDRKPVKFISFNVLSVVFSLEICVGFNCLLFAMLIRVLRTSAHFHAHQI